MIGNQTNINFFERYIQEQRQSLLNMQAVPIAEEIFCELNDDCIDTTYCCSDYSCVHPSKCLHGQKVTEDTCDYNFECYSRCCTENMCVHFLNCYKTCGSNQECKDSQCCSEGYCTHDVVCAGNKVTGDSCDLSDECLTEHCDKATHRCAAVLDISGPKIDIVGIISICLSSLIVVLFFAYCCKAWTSKRSNNYFAASTLNSNGDSD